jgi:hypothetical protein
VPGAGCRSLSSGRSSGSAIASEPIADASSQARAQLPAHSSYSMASRTAGSSIGSSRRQDPISRRASSHRPDPSAARARSSIGMAGCLQSSSAAMPRAHGCSSAIPGTAAISTASATRSITAGLASQAGMTAEPATSAEMHPSAWAPSPVSNRPRGPNSRCVSSHRGTPACAASPAAAESSPARSAEASSRTTSMSGGHASPAVTAGA